MMKKIFSSIVYLLAIFSFFGFIQIETAKSQITIPGHYKIPPIYRVYYLII